MLPVLTPHMLQLPLREPMLALMHRQRLHPCEHFFFFFFFFATSLEHSHVSPCYDVPRFLELLVGSVGYLRRTCLQKIRAQTLDP